MSHNLPFYRRLPAWSRRVKLARYLSIILAISSVISGIVSYVIIAHSKTLLGPKPEMVLTITLVNLTLLLLLAVVVLRRAFRLWTAFKQGSAGSRLQTQVVIIFSLATILPTLIISVFAAIYFNYGIQSWFNAHVSTALEESLVVAQSYLKEHNETIRSDAIAMASDLKDALPQTYVNPMLFENIVNSQTALRSLAEAVVIQKERVVARSHLSFTFGFEGIPRDKITRAKQGETVIIDRPDKVIALILLDAQTETYLYISRLVDSNVLEHVNQTNGAVSEYQRLRAQMSSLRLQFSAAFLLVTLLLLLAVVWAGMSFASRMVVPLSRMIRATERVRAGDFSIRVDAGDNDNEISTLIKHFNRMTEQLQAQRTDITQANRLIDTRRRFMEAVLEGASAGVIAVDYECLISLFNRSAANLLHLGDDVSIVGKNVTDIVPQINDLLAKALQQPNNAHQENITLVKNNNTLTLHVRITAALQGENIEGMVITFDDISELVKAQRRSAWSDVARRIAHEIKNPLTPIQLSTERLRKKYLPADAEEQTNFLRYLDTITRHVGDIGNMVEEFVSFARMPNPVFKPENIGDILNKAVFSAQTAFPNITYSLTIAKKDFILNCDERKIGQALTNLLKNASEALEGRPNIDDLPLGKIIVTTLHEQGKFSIIIRDNGTGFPPDKIEKLTEPYVTTRSKGTGLGLSIVKKTMEDHNGSLILRNNPEGGAEAVLVFVVEN